MYRPPLLPGNIPGTHLYYRLSQPQGHNAAGRIMLMENSNDNIGNRTRNLHACSAVPQSTAPPRAPNLKQSLRALEIKPLNFCTHSEDERREEKFTWTHYKFYLNTFKAGLTFFVVIWNSMKVFYKTSLLSDSYVHLTPLMTDKLPHCIPSFSLVFEG